MFSFLLWLIFGLGSAHAQQVQCATRPYGDSTNACASTAFVNNTFAGWGLTGLSANQPLIGSGTGYVTQGTRSGNTVAFTTVDGSTITGHCVQWDSSGGLVDAGGACSGGTVSAGTKGQTAIYTASGTTVSGVSGCIPIEAYGGAGNNSTDNVTPLNNLLTSFGTGSGCVAFGPGTYKFNSTISFTFSATQQDITFQGLGHDISNLLWPTSNAFSFTLNSASGQTFRFRSLGLQTSSAGGYIAISATNSVQGGSLHQNEIFHTFMGGSDGGQGTYYWGTAVNLIGVSNVVVDTSIIVGPTPPAGNGIVFEGNISGSFKWALNLNAVNTQFENLNAGILLPTYWQGIQVTNCNFSNGQQGIYVATGDTSGGLSGLQVSNSQFGATTGTDVYIASPVTAVAFTNNQIIVPSGGNGIQIATQSLAGGTFMGNVFSNTPAHSGNGLVLGSSQLAGNFPSQVIGNTFAYFSTGLVAQAGSNWVTVGLNGYNGNSTDSLNSGASACPASVSGNCFGSATSGTGFVH